MATVINLSVPKGWRDLSQEQLLFLLHVMVSVNAINRTVGYRSREHYTAQVAAQVQTICFFKWSGITVVCPYGRGYLVRSGEQEFQLDVDMLLGAVSSLDWIRELPSVTVRLEKVDGATAIPADISSGLSFDGWLACEANWQNYQSTHDDAALRNMAAILYNKDDIKLSAAESLGVFYWWAGVKAMVSAMFPNFFKPSAPADLEDGSTPASYDEMRRNIDAQIRALTKGDITKEAEVLSLDALRALTELDAQAREYDELQKRYPTK